MQHSMDRDKPMTAQESYVERRQLFKDIWETSMHIDDKEDIMNKPKVIKTLRLDEVDKYPVGKSKKQRLRNLRHVCNKILDFCDRQEADDKFYEQAKQNTSRNVEPQQMVMEAKPKPKKLKNTRTRKKIKKTKSLFTPRAVTVARATISDKDDLASTLEKMSRPTSPIKVKRTRLKSQSVKATKPVKPKQSPVTKRVVRKSTDVPGEPIVHRRKIVKKRRVKRKKKCETGVESGGGLNWPDDD